MAIVLVPKYARLGEGFTRQEQHKAMEHPGRRTNPKHGYQSQASWISDLAELRKCILLCSFCRKNFNHRKWHYRKMYVADQTGLTDGYTANGMCDACKQQTVNTGGGTAYIHEAEYNKVCVSDPLTARRMARAKARSMSAWRFINQTRR